MDLEYKYGQMEQNMKENGDIIKHKEKGNLLTPMEIRMTEIGRMTWQMDMESINI